MCQRGELQRDRESREIPWQIWNKHSKAGWQTQILPRIALTKSYRQPVLVCFFFSLSMQKKLQNELINYSIATAILSDLVVSTSSFYNLHYQRIMFWSSLRHFQVKNTARPHNVAIVKTMPFVIVKEENLEGRPGLMARKVQYKGLLLIQLLRYR